MLLDFESFSDQFNFTFSPHNNIYNLKVVFFYISDINNNKQLDESGDKVLLHLKLKKKKDTIKQNL